MVSAANAPYAASMRFNDNFLAAIFGYYDPAGANSSSSTGGVAPASAVGTVSWTGMPDVTKGELPRPTPRRAGQRVRVPIVPVEINGRMVTPAQAGQSGLTVGMRSGDGSPLIGVTINGATSEFGLCAANTHSMCRQDAPVCWGFVCLPRKGLGGFCTHDVQCATGRCGGLFVGCATCSADSQCASTHYCSNG
jgi:hypothetical protein